MLTKVTSQDDEVDSDIEVSAGSQGQKPIWNLNIFLLNQGIGNGLTGRTSFYGGFPPAWKSGTFFFGGFHSCKAGTTVVGTMDVDEEESSGDSPRTGGFVKSWNWKKPAVFKMDGNG